jgi:hypothetical protein
MEREREEKRKMEKLEDKIEKISQDVGSAIGSLEDKIMAKIGQKTADETSVEEIPIDAEGNPTTSDKAVSVKRTIRGSGGATRTDPFDMYLKIKQAEHLDKSGQLDAEGVRQIVKEETKPTAAPEIAELSRRIDGLNQQLTQQTKDMSEREQQALRDQISDLKNEVRSINTSGINSTEGMLASVGGKLVDKNPLKEMGLIAKELLTPSALITPSAQAPPVAQQPGTSSGIIAALKEKGLVTSIRERVVGPRQ